MRRVVIAVVASLISACAGTPRGAAEPSAPTGPTTRAEEGAGPEVDDGGTSCVVEGKRVSFSDFQGYLGAIVVDPNVKATSKVVTRGGFEGTEEHYSARRSSDGAEYDYRIVRGPTHHHYEISLVRRGSGPSTAPLSSSRPVVLESLSVDGNAVDRATFEAMLAKLDVDSEPWVNAHTQNSEGEPGTSASFEARDKKTGELWTLRMEGRVGRGSRSLARGSRKSGSPRRQ